jgi:hypothetical protein
LIPFRLDRAADEAASRYDALAQTFSALHTTALMSGEFGFAGQSERVFREAYDAAGVYFDRDKGVMNDLVHAIASEAHQSALSALRSIDTNDLSDAALAHLSETQTYLSNEIAAQVHRDIAQLRQAVQRAVLSVSMIERSRRIPTRQAQMAYMMKGHEGLQLVFTDRRGRRTQSRTFIRSIYRQALLSIHNEVTLHVIVDHGVEEAAIMKLHEGQIEQIGSLNVEDYAELRDTYFHPNSNAWLEVEAKNVRA